MADPAKNEEDLIRSRRGTGKSVVSVTIPGAKSKSRIQILDRSMSRARMRRSSYGFSSVPGIAAVRSSHIALEFRRPPLIYLPTYQLEPSTGFDLAVVLRVINDALDEEFAEHKYSAQNSPQLALNLAASLVKCTRDLFNRYRIIAVVSIGQRRAQSISTSLTFLWDPARDNYADVVRQNTTCYIQATIIAIYFD